jgi:hypothetical protein
MAEHPCDAANTHGEQFLISVRQKDNPHHDPQDRQAAVLKFHAFSLSRFG